MNRGEVDGGTITHPPWVRAANARRKAEAASYRKVESSLRFFRRGSWSHVLFIIIQKFIKGQVAPDVVTCVGLRLPRITNTMPMERVFTEGTHRLCVKGKLGLFNQGSHLSLTSWITPGLSHPLQEACIHGSLLTGWTAPGLLLKMKMMRPTMLIPSTL